MKLFLISFLFVISAHAEKAPAPACKDDGKIYKVCSNQEESYRSALAAARKDKKLLVVVIGAEWCPWCIALDKLLEDPDRIGKDFSSKFSKVGIALYQERKKLPSGVAVQELLKKQAGYKKKLAGIPVMALVNPKTKKTKLIDTEPLEQNTETTKGHDPHKVIAALEEAAKELK